MTNTPPPVSTNQAPAAVASSDASTVTEGAQIMLSSSGSTDADGDALSFSWIQTDGTNVLPNGAISTPNLTVNAPNVDADSVLSFQLTVSDGTDSSTDTVSVIVEPLGFQSTEILGEVLAETSANSFTLIDSTEGIGISNFISQEFSSDGSPIGNPITGSFSAENTNDSSTLDLITHVRSGNTLYNILRSTFSSFSSSSARGPQSIQLLTVRGPIDQDFQNFGDTFASALSLSSPGLSPDTLSEVDAIAFGTADQLAVIAGGNRFIGSSVLNPDGSLASFVNLTINGPPVGSPEIISFNDNTYAGYWTSNNEIQIQRAGLSDVGIDGNLLGTRIVLNPTLSDFIGDVSVAALPNNRAMIAVDEGENVGTDSTSFPDPRIIIRVVNITGQLETNAVDIGGGTLPQAISLTDGNILIVWEGQNNGLVARIVTPTGEFGSAIHILSPENLSTPPSILQLEDGRVIISDGDGSILSFPIEALDLFPVLSQ